LAASEVQRISSIFSLSGDPMMKTFFSLLALLFLFGVSYSQALPAPQNIEEAYLARDTGDGKAGEQVTEFATTDVPIYCVILLETPVTTVVKMNFVAVAVTGVKPDTKVVSATYTTKEGQNQVNFTGRPDSTWTPGRYRVDLFLNGKMVRNLEFSIKSSASGLSGSASFQPAKPAPRKPRH
jgi:hypothetical protein